MNWGSLISAILVAIIGGTFSLAGIKMTIKKENDAIQKKNSDNFELVLYRVGQLEAKQDKYNNVIERTYICEDRLNVQEEQIKVANHRIDDLEKKGA